MSESEKKPTSLGGHISSPISYTSSVQLPVPNDPLKEAEKVRGELDDLKKKIIKKFSFTLALSILPAAAFPVFEEEEGLTKEEIARKPLHLYMIVPEEEYSAIAKKIKPELLKIVQESKQNVWIHIKTPIDVWNYGLDSKFDMIDAVGASFPLYDKGFLGALRVANIHKTLVLRKFEKYVATYAVGGSLVRGTADKDSDVDTFVVIDDTDVKKMPRMQLLEKLRGFIYDYIREASALAGVKNILNVQVYLLTDFWQSVKDATPVIFTFIRDGVPMHDRGTFLPWKMLLKMGKIKPSPEAVDTFMKYGEQNDALVKRRLMDAMIDLYWSVVTPTQALMMLAGHAPPVPKTIVADVKKEFVEKERLMAVNDIKTLERAVKLYKDYEHGALKEISGAEIDSLLKEANAYDKSMRAMRAKLERRIVQKDADALYVEVVTLLENSLGKHAKEELVKQFDKQFVKSGKLAPRLLPTLRRVFELKQKAKNPKFSQHALDDVRRDAEELITKLSEYIQRRDLIKAERGIVKIKTKERVIELLLTNTTVFAVDAGKVLKLHNGSFVASDATELDAALKSSKDTAPVLSEAALHAVKKHFGSFEITF
ncbi:MAG: nucleotidyltransferase domain-containing protein [Nanoarchaeota archaeon]